MYLTLAIKFVYSVFYAFYFVIFALIILRGRDCGILMSGTIVAFTHLFLILCPLYDKNKVAFNSYCGVIMVSNGVHNEFYSLYIKYIVCHALIVYYSDLLQLFSLITNG